MKFRKKLCGLNIEVVPIKPRVKKKLEDVIIMVKEEIKEWRKFLRDCEKKLNNK